MITQIINELKQLDIKLTLDGDELCIDAPKGILTEDRLRQLKKYKTEIVNYLSDTNTITIDYLKSEAVLDRDITPQNLTSPNISTAKHILLTGATGFIGAFLLANSLQQTTANIYCLIRSKNVDLANIKLRKCLDDYYLTENIDFSRIIVLTGDLSKEKFDLPLDIYQELTKKIDIIYHNGALVHHASPYKSLKSTNVLGTQEILRLACTEKIKSVHFISTISVFNLERNSKVNLIKEEDNLEKYQAPLGGYSQSKWVAEKLVAIASERGLPVKIYRLGPVSGSSKTGVFNSSDFLYRLILGYVHLGTAPEGEMLLDILPVDYVGSAIAHLSQSESSWGKAFHLIHQEPQSSNLLFERLNAFGYKIKRVPYRDWYGQLIDIAQRSQNHILYPLVSLFSANNSKEAQSKSFNLKFDCQNTVDGLAKSGLTCPVIDAKLLDTYISFLIEHNLVPTSK